MLMSTALEPYLLFTVIWFVAAATPGIDTMLLLTTSLSTGWKSAISISLGITAAKVLLLTLTYFGLTALLSSNPEIFVLLKVFGCAFLLWRALKLWTSKLSISTNSRVGFWPNLSFAFTAAVSNPQALLFYVAVVPQVAGSTNVLILNLIIAIGFPIISAIYIGLAVPIRAWISRGPNQRLVNRVVALVFVALAIVLALR
jgi:threonine/homoserine/homoserine lactone efflux protein